MTTRPKAKIIIAVPKSGWIATNTKKINDTIEEKILDIEKIKELTSRYENWSSRWDDKATLVGKELSIDEIDLIKSEIKRISRKLWL